MSEKLFAGLTYEQTVNKYAQTVTSVCIMRLKNYSDAEDCFQNTFIKLYANSPEFSDETHLKAWLIRVAINECKDHIFRSCRNLPLDRAEALTFSQEDERDASWALMRTAPKYREVLYLYYCERYKVDEIAQILGKKPNTVKSLLKRGREQLRKNYGGGDT